MALAWGGPGGEHGPSLRGVPAAVVVAPGSPVEFVAKAMDPDLVSGLGNAMTFNLVGRPANAVIDPDSGAFTWTPDETNPPGTYTFKVRVTDDGVPALSRSKTVSVSDDGVQDVLIGGLGADWFLAGTADTADRMDPEQVLTV